jgi:hypothetical protein
MCGMYDRDAPAKLFYWPAEHGAGDEETVYPRLDDALRAAEDNLANAWIITQAGDILNPRKIAALQLDTKPERERCARARHLLGLSPVS